MQPMVAYTKETREAVWAGNGGEGGSQRLECIARVRWPQPHADMMLPVVISLDMVKKQ